MKLKLKVPSSNAARDWLHRLLTLACVWCVCTAPLSAQNNPGDELLPRLLPEASERRLPVEDARSKCISFSRIRSGDDYLDCAVSEAGVIGEVDGQEYSFAVYCLIPAYVTEPAKCGDGSFNARYHHARGLAIFARSARQSDVSILLDPTGSELGLVYYQTPELIPTPAGVLLHVPIAVDGTGAGNESLEYLRVTGKWTLLDSASWLGELLKSAPAGLQILKGVWPDFKTMTARTSLYRDGDANCCPSGGSLLAKLAIAEGKIILESATYEPKPPDVQ